MLYLTAADLVLAVAAALWLRRLMRARGQDIPCTRKVFSWVVVAAGVLAMLGVVLGNILGLIPLDRLLGREKSGVLFVVWLLAMSAGAILFIVALTAFHTNRTAAAWIRVMPPGGFSLRTGGESTLVKLAPGLVRVIGLAEGIGGIIYVQYRIADGARELDLIIQFVRGARVDGAPWLAQPGGLIVQGAARTLHQLFAPFIASESSTRSAPAPA